MSESFERTLRSLDSDRGRPATLALGVGGLLCAVWALWMLLGAVPVNATSRSARIEAALVPRELKTAIAGRVTSVHVALGERVSAGQTLVSLDDASARAAIDDARALRDSLATQIERLEAARDALSAAGREGESARISALSAARAEADKAQRVADQAAEEARRAADLASSGAISAQELERAKTEAERWSIEAQVRLQLYRQSSSERTSAQQGEQVELGRVDQELAALEGQRASADANLKAAELLLERHYLVSPVDGTVGALSVRDEGAVIAVGDPVATIVPDGGLQAVALFAPAAALGRIRSGQRARIRLDGFPWTAYGSLDARVERVADEPTGPNAEEIRVELSLHPGPSFRVPLQHGLPGQVEVEVDRLSPAALVLRTVGGRAP